MNEALKEKITADFDLISSFEKENWTHNNHFSGFLLGKLPQTCDHALEIGCGIGTFTRRMAARARRVTGLDLSPKMIETARALSSRFDNIDFRAADILETKLPPAHFDAIVSVATFHHLPLERVLPELKEALKPGGRLLVLDVLEMKDFQDYLMAAASVPLSFMLKIFHNGFTVPTREEREAWVNHAKTDCYLTFRQAREVYPKFLAGAVIRRELFFRYSVVWEK